MQVSAVYFVVFVGVCVVVLLLSPLWDPLRRHQFIASAAIIAVTSAAVALGRSVDEGVTAGTYGAIALGLWWWIRSSGVRRRAWWNPADLQTARLLRAAKRKQ